MPPSPSLPEFFTDRSLGAHDVPTALRADGWHLRTHKEIYGHRDEVVPDTEWLEMCGRESLAVLTADRRIRYRTAELDALKDHGVRAFALTHGNLTADAQAARFQANKEAIFAACAFPGPFLFIVHERQIVRVAAVSPAPDDEDESPL